MIEFWVDPSHENDDLAREELDGALRALHGQRMGAPSPSEGRAHLQPVELPSRESARELGSRLALAWRVLEPWPELTMEEAVRRFRSEGAQGGSAAFRPLGSARAPIDSPDLAACARSFREGGGAIDLRRPARRFFLSRGNKGSMIVAEEVATVDRAAFTQRRMPTLPFRRPVSLPPKLGRVVVNLGAVRRGDRVIDPFVGTGALVLEAALLGAHVTGVDFDPAMVRGAIQNLAARGCEFESIWARDAAESAEAYRGPPFDALISDPPYGRSAGSGGETPEHLLARVIPLWARQVRPEGRVVLVVPGGPDPIGLPWVRIASVRDRVHRSLTREFRVFERRGAQ